MSYLLSMHSAHTTHTHSNVTLTFTKTQTYSYERARTHTHTHTHSHSHIYLQTVITSEVQLSVRTPPPQNTNGVRSFEMRSVLFSPKSRPKISSQRLLLCNQDKDTECCLYFHTVFLDALCVCVRVCVCGDS